MYLPAFYTLLLPRMYLMSSLYNSVLITWKLTLPQTLLCPFICLKPNRIACCLTQQVNHSWPHPDPSLKYPINVTSQDIRSLLWEHHAGCMSHALVEQINDNCEGALRVGQHNTVTTVHTKHGCRMSLHMHACNLVVITVLLPSLVPVFIPFLGVTEWKFEVTNSAYLHYLAVSIHT